MNEYDEDIPDEPEPDDVFVPSDDYMQNLITASQSGYPMAQTMLGFDLRQRKEYAESYRWFKEGAQNGSLLAKIMTIIIEDTEHFKGSGSPERLLEYASSGFPKLTARLAAIYHRKNPQVAKMYAAVSNLFYNVEVDRDFSFLKMDMTEKEKAALLNLAETLMFTWAQDPHSYLSGPGKWCKTANDWTKSCIINALTDHEGCMMPYWGFGFQLPERFPGYSRCRVELRKTPNL